MMIRKIKSEHPLLVSHNADSCPNLNIIGTDQPVSDAANLYSTTARLIHLNGQNCCTPTPAPITAGLASPICPTQANPRLFPIVNALTTPYWFRLSCRFTDAPTAIAACIISPSIYSTDLSSNSYPVAAGLI